MIDFPSYWKHVIGTTGVKLILYEAKDVSLMWRATPAPTPGLNMQQSRSDFPNWVKTMQYSIGASAMRCRKLRLAKRKRKERYKRKQEIHCRPKCLLLSTSGRNEMYCNMAALASGGKAH